MNWPPPECLQLEAACANSSPRWPEALSNVLATATAAVPVGVACSGGADSVYLLLRAMHRVASPEHLRVLHFDHRVRESSAQDAAFVATLAQRYGLRLLTAQREATGEASEATLRQARMAFFAHNGVPHLLLGHHRDDAVETLLMRLARGSGLEGLCAPRVQEIHGQQTFWRPLLGTTRAQIREALQGIGQCWCEDASNASAAYLRNRIRHQLLPRWAQLQERDISQGIARAHQLLSEDHNALQHWLASIMPQPQPGKPLDGQPLRGLPRALWRRALQQWLRQQQLTLRPPALEALLEGWQQQQTLRLAMSEGVLCCAGSRIEFIQSEGPPSWAAVTLCPGMSLVLPGGQWITAQRVTLTSEQRVAILTGQVANEEETWLALPPQPLTLRRWQAGDRWRPLGSPGTRKLQDSFTDARIPPEQRRQWPIIAAEDGKIVALPGFPPASLAAISHGTTEALKLTYQGFCGNMKSFCNE